MICLIFVVIKYFRLNFCREQQQEMADNFIHQQEPQQPMLHQHKHNHQQSMTTIAQHQQLPTSSSSNQYQDQGNRRIFNKTLTLLNSMCAKYLYGRCQNQQCVYSHSFVNPQELKKKLTFNSLDVTIDLYQVCLRFNRLFFHYFELICEIYGHRQQLDRLIMMINDVEKFDRPIHYYKYIVNGLTYCIGITKIKAVEILFKNRSLQTEKACHVLVEIIIDTDVIHFLRELQFLSSKFTLQWKSVDRLLEICLLNQNSDLSDIIYKQICQRGSEVPTNLNKNNLKQFLTMIKTN